MNRDTLALEIVETARALRRAFDRRATEIGVTRAQWQVLSKLSRNPGLKQVELADLLEIEPITLCRHIDRLEEAELVTRRRDPNDRRAWRLELTPKAAPTVENLKSLASHFATDAFGPLSDAEASALSATLADVRENLVRSADPSKATA